jgi:hypothetical protein
MECSARRRTEGKVIALLNYVIRHHIMKAYGGVAPTILNLGTT